MSKDYQHRDAVVSSKRTTSHSHWHASDKLTRFLDYIHKYNKTTRHSTLNKMTYESKTHSNLTKYSNTDSQLTTDNDAQHEMDAMMNDVKDENLVTSYQVSPQWKRNAWLFFPSNFRGKDCT